MPPYTGRVTLVGLVMFILAQLVVVLVAGFCIFFGTIMPHDLVRAGGLAKAMFLVPGLAITIVDVLVLVGVVGPGLPLSAKTSTELLVAALGALAAIPFWAWTEDGEGGAIITSIVWLLVVGLVEWLLLAGVIWPQYHLTAGQPTPTVTVTRTVIVTAAPVLAPTPTNSVTAAPGPTPTMTVTVTAHAVTSPASASGQSVSGVVALAIAVVAAAGTLLGGLGGLLVGWGTLAKHRNRRKTTQKSPS